MKPPDALHEFFELLSLYPSPHNGQPVRIKYVSDNKYEAYFVRERGLQATDISYIFSFVSMGVFIAYALHCGRAFGHSVSYTLSLPKEAELRGDGRVKFADMTIAPSAQPADEATRTALQFRQTSRKKYTAGIQPEHAGEVKAIADRAGMRLTPLSPEQARQAIWLNQRAVFDDMFDPAVNKELDHWLRYSQKEKQTRRDGLAYDCMELSGPVMKFIVHHPGILRAPGISGLLKKYYLRTMADSSNVLYMLAPFANEDQAFKVGLAISDMWIALSTHGYYLHPFGTIMSNHAAHQDFIKLAGVQKETRDNYLVFIFRAGTSPPPVRSARLPYQEHLIME